MAPEILPHARLEDGNTAFGVQPAAVDDGHASMAKATAVDELLHVRDGFRGCLAVQIKSAACGVVSSLEFSQLAPIDTRRGVSLVRSYPIVITRRRCRRGRRRPLALWGHHRSRANAPTIIWRERDDVRHCVCEMVNVGVRVGRPVALR